MKKIITVLLIVSMLFCTVACSGTEKEPQITGTATGLTSKMENALELQKSIFICDVLSVSREDAIVPKYNSGITNYSVYNVNITESINGYAPLGEAFVYCMGTSEEFIERIGLKKGETLALVFNTVHRCFPGHGPDGSNFLTVKMRQYKLFDFPGKGLNAGIHLRRVGDALRSDDGIGFVIKGIGNHGHVLLIKIIII